jgi:hypothetical protein
MYYLFIVQKDYYYRVIPFVVVTHNRASGLLDLFSFLQRQQLPIKLVIADMESSFPPMLELLTKIENSDIEELISLEVEVWRLPNIGPRALWFSQKFRDLVGSDEFFLSDGDLDYTNTSSDALSNLRIISKKYSGFPKVGAALSLEDLPVCSKSTIIVSGESRNFRHSREIEKDVFLAPVDTTLAYYPKYEADYSFWPALRVAGSSTVIHSPWYESDVNLTKEQSFYLANQREDISTLGGRNLVLTDSTKPLKIDLVLPVFKLFLRYFPTASSSILKFVIRTTNRNSRLKI